MFIIRASWHHLGEEEALKEVVALFSSVLADHGVFSVVTVKAFGRVTTCCSNSRSPQPQAPKLDSLS